jgi:hypothetical protein
MATRLLVKSVKYWAVSLAVVWLAALGATGVQAQGKSSGTKIRLGTPSASLSYLPSMRRCRRVSSPDGV